ncbi:DUF551 domain-containing protein [Citrobacter sp. Cf098]|uniref:DUF551 domain-containing protein n=1 Tax=Citrobacter sp. Cf098 TaxID=2985060 RepID=UPI002574B3AA|nr:DUF551 domain-containing protein [Citrobacter sp. Cf098]MDM3181993.1 DUF551 domain-containing protein [Citrobacter sp. Cf098]MDM3182361.1 DUF551 domain-containing protein [Citrobacter sp. Cf098]
MAEFTKERLQEIAEDGFLKHGEAKAMARQLLAGMEQEPLHEATDWQVNEAIARMEDEADMVLVPRGLLGAAMGAIKHPKHESGVTIGSLRHYAYKPKGAAPQLPQPAVDELLKEHLRLVECMLVEYREGNSGQAKEWIRHISKSSDKFEEKHSLSPWLWVRSVYRAAMLQGEPVSQPDELPMDYLQGHKDGLEWAARLAEANHPQTGDWLYDDPLELAKAIRKGPDMPAQPVQGWIPCSERMPEEIGRYWCYVEEQNSLGKSHYQWNCSWNGELWGGEMMYGRVTHWMPLQEPPKQTSES